MILYFLGIIIPNLILNFVLFRFFYSAFDAVYQSKAIYIIMYGILVLVQSFMAFSKQHILGVVSYIILIMLICFCGFRSSIKNRIIYLLVYFTYILFVDIISVPIVVVVSDESIDATITDPLGMFISGMITSLLALGTYHLPLRVGKKYKVEKLTRSQEGFITLLTIFEILIIYTILKINDYGTNGIESFWVLPAFLLLNIYLIHLFETISEKNKLELKNSLYEQQILLNENNIKNLDTQNQNYRKILHDIRYHIQLIQRNPSISDEYCKDLLEYINKEGYTFSCTNPILNTIVNNVILECRQKNIEFIPQVEIAEWGGIKNIDITTIFANLLNNALEANSDIVGRRYIIMKVKHVKSFLVIYIENSCYYEQEFYYVEGRSMKANHMGIGLANVKKIVKSYNGDMEISCEKERFIVKVVFHDFS